MKFSTRQIGAFIQSITVRPAATILLSFVIVILCGTLLLQLPFTTVDGMGLTPVNALFTATSAVCVTGLIVVDTAAFLTFWGQLIVLILIQIGGLSFMVLSYFAIFVLHRSVSVEDKLLLSYLLNEDDMTGLAKTVSRIIYITFTFEAAGALILLTRFVPRYGLSGSTVFNALFHGISAFCNAGFSLFSDSLEQFSSDPVVLLTIGLLIIFGGLSFGVIINAGRSAKVLFSKKKTPAGKLSLNTKVVLAGTGILLTAAFFIIYPLEHGNTLQHYSLGNQYLNTFFQAVTLRTAGFNSIPFGHLTTTTYLVLIVFMFVGGATGSTAGGIKINNAAVMYGYIKSILSGSDSVVLFKHSISENQVNKSFLVFTFSIMAVIGGTIILSASDGLHGAFGAHGAQARLPHILFETVSALGTVGLSAGITPDLSTTGKLVISGLMLLGRIGPITVLAAGAGGKEKVRMEYPQGDITIS